jgi:tetratricopeptide (TPR) repeat protein
MSTCSTPARTRLAARRAAAIAAVAGAAAAFIALTAPAGTAVAPTTSAAPGIATAATATATAPAAATATPPAAYYDAAALYNAGNAAARAGRYAQAILNYERAQLLAPRDPDVRANLAQVRARAGVEAEPPRAWLRRARFARPDHVYEAGLLALTIAGIALLMRERWRPALDGARPTGSAAATAVPSTAATMTNTATTDDHHDRSPRRLLGGLAIAALIALAVCCLDAIATVPAIEDAVVLEAGPASASPSPAGAALFTLREGETVTLEQFHASFCLVRDPTGREGWVARTRLAPVVP